MDYNPMRAVLDKLDSIKTLLDRILSMLVLIGAGVLVFLIGYCTHRY